MARLAIFIDGAYLKNITQKSKIWADYQKLVEAVHRKVSDDTAEPLDLLRTYYYDCLPWRGEDPTPGETERYNKSLKFFEALKHIPKFDVRLGRLQKLGESGTGSPILKQKQVDLKIGLDIARLSLKARVSHIALVSGDSDFLPVVELAKEEGVAIWLFHGDRESYARELWIAADEKFHFSNRFLKSVARQR